MFTGVYVYVWQPQSVGDGTLAGIIALAKRYKIGLLWKAADGGRWYPNITDKGNTPITTLVDACRQAGVPVGTWDYSYGAPAPQSYYGYSVLTYQDELQRAIETISAANPDFHAINNEVEYEADGGRWQAAQYIAQGLRTKFPNYPLVSACLPVMRYHTLGGYRQFADAQFIQAPELYWSMFRGTVASQFISETNTVEGAGVVWKLPHIIEAGRTANLSTVGAHLLDASTLVQYWHQDCTNYQIPTMPYAPTYMDAPLAGAAFGVTDAELTQFLAALDHTDAASIWVWDLQHMDAAALSRTQQVSEWLALADPTHKRDLLIEAARSQYKAGNDAMVAVLTNLGVA